MEDGKHNCNNLYISEVSYKLPIENLIELNNHFNKITYITYLTVEPGEDEREIIVLSSDLGITPFENEIKASMLNRWIGKAIDKNSFVKIS